MASLTSLQLEGNPLHCDCRLEWLAVWLSSKVCKYLYYLNLAKDEGSNEKLGNKWDVSAEGTFLFEGVFQICFCDHIKGVLCISSSFEWSATLLCASQHFGMHWQPKGSHTSKVRASMGLDFPFQLTSS